MIHYFIDVNEKKSQIDKNIYGHFSEHLGRCIYEGIFVGADADIPNVDGMRLDVVEALKKMGLPVLRWPGGCFADEYHWKDGIGPLASRKKMINTHWGGVVEDNSFGTHEFMRLCELVGCEPYINGNVGSGTVQEMSEWVEYMTFDGLSPMAGLREENGSAKAWPVKYFGVGNENWGCGGNMRPEYYADLYRRFATYVRNYGDNKIFKVACGPNSADYHWMEVLMDRAAKYMDGISLHYYTIEKEWADKGSATEFGIESYYKLMHKTMFMEELITKHSQIMDKYDKEKRVALMIDEWGTWFNVEPGTNPGFLYQQNTMRDAVLAGVNLNIFNKHSDRVRMANIAQLVNVLQAVILTEGERMILTPTYHVFEMYSAHQDNRLLESYLAAGMVGVDGDLVPEVVESASINDLGEVVITLCNLDVEASKEVVCQLAGFVGGKIIGEIISGAMDGHNTFDAPTVIEKKSFTGAVRTDDGFRVSLPPCSVVKLVLMA